MDEDDLMFGEMERVMETPFDQGVEDEAAIRASCEKEIKLYINTPGIPLRTSDGKFSDPLQWWEDMSDRKKFPILSQLASQFLAIPATSAPSERNFSRSALVLTAKRSRLASPIVSAIVLMSENEDAVRKHIEKMYPGGHPKVFLPENMELSEKEKLDIGQDLFDLKF